MLPALLPGLLVLLLGFQAGGFFPDAWAPVAAVLVVVLAVRLAVVDRPFAGLSAWSGVALGALALLGVWMLVSASWSDAPGRATLEFARLLLYGLVLMLCASLAPREHRLSWALRGLVLAIAAICVAGLITRLRPDIWSVTGIEAGRLDFPITYWNGLGLIGAVGAVLALHLSAFSREPWPVRVLAAAVVPLAAVTVFLTLSRGGIAAGALAIVVYLVCGFSRATPGALLAIVPPTTLVVLRVYDAERLVTPEYADAAGRAEGREIATALAIAVVAAIALRAAALFVDRFAERAPSLGRISRARAWRPRSSSWSPASSWRWPPGRRATWSARPTGSRTPRRWRTTAAASRASPRTGGSATGRSRGTPGRPSRCTAPAPARSPQ